MARYDAFLLRVRQRGGAPPTQMSVQLQHLPDGDICRFNTLASLLVHLTRELGVHDEVPPSMGSADSAVEERKEGN
jgi:hypothetical protein